MLPALFLVFSAAAHFSLLLSAGWGLAGVLCVFLREFLRHPPFFKHKGPSLLNQNFHICSFSPSSWLPCLLTVLLVFWFRNCLFFSLQVLGPYFLYSLCIVCLNFCFWIDKHADIHCSVWKKIHHHYCFNTSSQCLVVASHHITNGTDWKIKR